MKLHDDKKIFCVHGGLPMTGYGKSRTQFVEYIEYIYNPSKSEPEPEFPSDFEMQLLWNDPKIRGVREHILTYVHTEEIAGDYMKKLGWSYIFRGHQYVKEGFRRDFEGINEFTVFSSCNFIKKEASDHTAAIVKIIPGSHEYEVVKFNHKPAIDELVVY